MAYGSSQARGRIGAAAASLHHSSQQCWILNPLSEARDGTRNFMLTSRIIFCCSTTETLVFAFYFILFYFIFLLFFRASMAHGGSQARG